MPQSNQTDGVTREELIAAAKKEGEKQKQKPFVAVRPRQEQYLFALVKNSILATQIAYLRVGLTEMADWIGDLCLKTISRLEAKYVAKSGSRLCSRETKGRENSCTHGSNMSRIHVEPTTRH